MATEDFCEECRAAHRAIKSIDPLVERKRVEELIATLQHGFKYEQLVQMMAHQSGRPIEEIRAEDRKMAQIRARQIFNNQPLGLPDQSITAATVHSTQKLTHKPHSFPHPWEVVIFKCRDSLIESPTLVEPIKLLPTQCRLLDLFAENLFEIIPYPQLNKALSSYTGLDIGKYSSLRSHISRLRSNVSRALASVHQPLPEILPNFQESGWSLLPPELRGEA